MTSTLLIFYLFYLQYNLLDSGAQGVDIKVYSNRNFQGLVWESNSTSACENVPKNKFHRVNSIKTDTCFIAYNDPNCKSWRSEKYMPGDTVLNSRQVSWIESFHICNEDEGSSQLNVDITKYYDKNNVTKPYAIHESYKNVCSCVNVPEYVQKLDKWAVDNHHNSMMAYYEPDCSVNKWNAEFISAGQYYGSRLMHQYKRTDNGTNEIYKIQSFGPDPNATYYKMGCPANMIKTSIADPKIEVIEGLNNLIEEMQTQVDILKSKEGKYQSDILPKFRSFTFQTKAELQKLFPPS